MKEGEDYIINDQGLLVFTKEYHLKRGSCCKNKCLNCPWNYGKEKGNNEIKKEDGDIG